jgi:hypothetical protein
MYVTFVWYVKPPKLVLPAIVNPSAKLSVSMIVDWEVALPINQSLQRSSLKVVYRGYQS